MNDNQPWALLLDDNLMSATRLQAQLRALGFQVRTARSLEEVDRSIVESTSESTFEPQAIVINLGSRRIAGVALIEACRARFPEARLVGFCGHLEIEIRRAAKAAGLARILTNDEAFSDANAWRAALGDRA